MGSIVEPGLSLVEELDALCDRAQFLTAYELIKEFAPPLSWRTPEALCVAARLVRHLGAHDLSKKLALRAYRLEPKHAEARYWAGGVVLERRGPLAAFNWLKGYEPPAEASVRGRAGICWLHALIRIAFRDFDGAKLWLERGSELEAERPYTDVMWVHWLSAQDRYAEALAKAAEGLERHPEHRASIECLADLQILHGKWEAALGVLQEGAKATQAGALYLEAARIELELQRPQAARASLAKAAPLLPLLEEGGQKLVAAMQSDAAYLLNDIDVAIREAKRAATPFFEQLVTRLETLPRAARVLLDVEFVRQHHMTCVPATLTTLSRFWQRPMDQVEVADKICFGGTPSHAERKWAEDNGFATREFTVTWEAACALLDRGVPFIVDTVHAISAHAQAIIGYDAWRGTLFIRDPFLPSTIEATAKEFLSAYEAHGPRGFVMVPRERAELLAGIELRDAELYDVLDRLESALELHDRVAAGNVARELEERAPGHRLSIMAERAIACYDANPFELRRSVERALELYPSEPTLLLSLLGTLRSTATSSEIIGRLEAVTSDPKAHPVFREILAGELLEDSRELEQATRMLRKVAQLLRDRASTLGLCAQATWQSLEFEAAVELYRFAACIEPTNDRWSQAYFRAALTVGRSDEALAFLRRRADEYAQRSCAPSLTLFSALESLDRSDEAFKVLEHAITRRPSDGDLRRFAAEAYGRVGNFAAARVELAAAEAHSARSAWLRSAATVAEYAAEHEQALSHWRAVVEAEPLAVDAHRALATRLATLHGQSKAREHLRQMSARFPNNAALFELYLNFLFDEDPKLVEPELRRFIALEPKNAWAQRELALVLSKLGDLEQAKRAAEVGLELAPHEVSGQLVRARVCELAGDFEAAKQAYWAAFRLAPDVPSTISCLLDAAADREESLATLREVEERLVRASATGNGILAWFEGARRHLSPEELAQRLEVLHSARPDLWSVWSCRVRHACDRSDSERALEIARAATERFPLLPGLWLARGRVHKLAQRSAEAISAIERALVISPGFTSATLMLAEILEHQGEFEQSLVALERALRITPLDTSLLVARADLLWQLERYQEALECVLRAVEVDPGDRGVWGRLHNWARSANQDLDVLATIRRLSERRPWDPQVLLRLSEIEVDSDANQALATVERAIELDPSLIEAHDLRVEIAAMLGHRALALAACRPKQLSGQIPIALRGREAWLKAVFGDVRAAISEMRALVSERPYYTWGLRQIADWAERVNDKDAALEATEALVRVEPTNPAVHGYRGKALLDAKRTAEARRSFEHALALDPSYRFAVHELFELLLQQRKLEACAELLARHDRHVPAFDRCHFRLRLALAYKRFDDVESLTRELFADPDAAPLLERTRRILAEHCRFRALQALEQLMLEPDAPGHVGLHWARLAVESGKASALRTWALRKANPEVRAQALVAIFEHLGERGRVLTALWMTLWNFGFARKNVNVWGIVGYVLANANWNLSAVLWLWSYEQRKPAAWILSNLAVAARGLGFSSFAARVSRDALTQQPDHTHAMHLTMLAFDAAVAGRTLEAQTLISEVGQLEAQDHFEKVRELTVSMTELALAPRDERSTLTAVAFGRLGALLPKRLIGCLILENIQWRRAARRIGQSSGTLSGMVRGYWDSCVAVALFGFLVWFAVYANGATLVRLVSVYVLSRWFSKALFR